MRMNIVRVGCTDKFFDGQSHFLGKICRKNIAEITCGNNDIDFVAEFYGSAVYHIAIRGNIIYNLGSEPAPVD